MIVITDPDPKFRHRAVRALDAAWSFAEVAGGEELEKLLGERPGEVEVVVLGPRLGDAALPTAERIRELDPAVSCILVHVSADAELMRSAVRCGVRDVVSGRCTGEQLRDAVAKARAVSRSLRSRDSRNRTRGCKVTTVFSLKGGSGKSVVAANLAVQLARTGEDVVLVDLDLQSGDLAVMLQARPARTIRDAAKRGDTLDDETLLGLLVEHRSGARLLAAPREPAHADDVTADTVARVLAILRRHVARVIVDCPAAFTEHVLAALDATDECLIVCALDVPNVKNAAIALRTLRELGFERERLRIVLNRADDDVALTAQHVQKVLGTPVDATIASSRDVTLSVNRGQPLAMNGTGHPLTAALERLTNGTAPASRSRNPIELIRRSFR